MYIKVGKIYVPLEVDGRIINQTILKFAKQISSKGIEKIIRKVAGRNVGNYLTYMGQLINYIRLKP